MSNAGNYYGNNTQGGNSSIFIPQIYSSTPMAGFVQSSTTIPSAQSVDHPFYMGPTSNVALSPTTIIGPIMNRQFDDGHSQAFMDRFFTHFTPNAQTNEINLPYQFLSTNPSFAGYNMADFGMVKTNFRRGLCYVWKYTGGQCNT